MTLNYIMTSNFIMTPNYLTSSWSIYIVHVQLVTNKINLDLSKRLPIDQLMTMSSLNYFILCYLLTHQIAVYLNMFCVLMKCMSFSNVNSSWVSQCIIIGDFKVKPSSDRRFFTNTLDMLTETSFGCKAVDTLVETNAKLLLDQGRT